MIENCLAIMNLVIILLVICCGHSVVLSFNIQTPIREATDQVVRENGNGIEKEETGKLAWVRFLVAVNDTWGK